MYTLNSIHSLRAILGVIVGAILDGQEREENRRPQRPGRRGGGHLIHPLRLTFHTEFYLSEKFMLVIDAPPHRISYLI